MEERPGDGTGYHVGRAGTTTASTGASSGGTGSSTFGAGRDSSGRVRRNIQGKNSTRNRGVAGCNEPGGGKERHRRNLWPMWIPIWRQRIVLRTLWNAPLDEFQPGRIRLLEPHATAAAEFTCRSACRGEAGERRKA